MTRLINFILALTIVTLCDSLWERVNADPFFYSPMDMVLAAAIFVWLKEGYK